MRVWVDVYDASGNRQGAGPVVSVAGAGIKRALDGAGTFDLRCVGTDTRALTLLQVERRVQVWVEDTGGKRLAGEGIIRQRNLSESPGGVVLRVSGPDILDELKRRNVLLARIYNQATVATVASDLIGLVPGWSVSVDASISSDTIDARYDGVSVLKAFQDLSKRYGYHLRYSSTASKTLEVGPFGDDNGLRIFKVENITTETLNNPDLLMVQQISTGEDSEALCNWMLPLGAGEGEAALTLEESTRTTPYTIQTATGPDGRTLYFISDAASVSSYGEIRQVGQFKEIAPLTNSATDITNAANALYDAAAEYLERRSVPQESYRVTVKNVKDSIQPGDKIHINYKAQVETKDGPVDYFSIRDDFWIMGVRESVGLDSSYVELEVSNVDIFERDVTETVMDAIERIELRGLKPMITSSARSYVYDREIADGFSAVVPIEFTDATLSLQRVRLRIKTSPFRATASGAASGGGSTETSASEGHTHTFMRLDSSPPSGTPTTRKFTIFNGTSTFFFEAPTTGIPPDTFEPTTDGAHTHDVTIPAHTHDIEFGIEDDTDYPDTITVEVNGVDETLALFGSATLDASGLGIDLVADEAALTNLILGESVLRKVHTIEIIAGGGQGRVEATVEVFETTQSIKLT